MELVIGSEFDYKFWERKMYTEVAKRWVVTVLKCIDRLADFKEWGKEVLPYRDGAGFEQCSCGSLLTSQEVAMLAEFEAEVWNPTSDLRHPCPSLPSPPTLFPTYPW